MVPGYCRVAKTCSCVGEFREARTTGACPNWITPAKEEKLRASDTTPVEVSLGDIADLLERKKLTRAMRDKLVQARYAINEVHEAIRRDK